LNQKPVYSGKLSDNVHSRDVSVRRK